ncbi:MAG TPA: NADH-quinone oxidoreductase subunit C [Chthoniobacteraceae bacterium]|jgi:NADH-quinone oxidoreductase subunit C|nr:NADH-quinone oxidoreductase subunit C [Chthoniobacteraceae bacterium]
MALTDSIASIEGKFTVLGKIEFRGETTLIVNREAILAICRHCKEELGFDFLIDVCSVDNFGQEPRFEMIYELSSIAAEEHLRLKCAISEDEPSVDSVTGIWPTANWHEREIYDMMGISFTGHPDLRRILMWDGYPYYPLRKDFPLAGKPSEVPEVAFTKPAPLEGGPFVTVPTTATTKDREPRARRLDD